MHYLPSDLSYNRGGMTVNGLSAILPVNLIIDIGEDIVFGFQLAQVSIIDTAVLQLLIEIVKIKNMLFRAVDGILHCRAGFHDKRPIAALSQQQFPGRLVERASLQVIRLPSLPNQSETPYSLCSTAFSATIFPLVGNEDSYTRSVIP